MKIPVTRGGLALARPSLQERAQFRAENARLRSAFVRARTLIGEAGAVVHKAIGEPAAPAPEVDRRERKARVSERGKQVDPPDFRYERNASELRIVDTLATFRSIGLGDVSRDTLALFCGISPTTKSHTYALSALLKDGLIEASKPGHVSLTEAGASIAIADETPPSLMELHRRWIARLRGKHKMAEVLEYMLQGGRDSYERPVVARAIGLSTTTKSFTYAISGLLDLGVIRTAGLGRVQLTDLLFPEGLE